MRAHLDRVRSSSTGWLPERAPPAATADLLTEVIHRQNNIIRFLMRAHLDRVRTLEYRWPPSSRRWPASAARDEP